MVVGKFGIAIFALCALTRAAGADTASAAYAPPDFMAALPPLPPGVEASKVWRLSLGEALQVALHQNLGIVVEREQVDVASLGITVAKGEFEPTLTAGYDHNRADSPPVTVQEGVPGENISFVTDDWHATLTDRLESGTLLSLDFSNGRARSSAGTAIEPLNYRSTLTLSVTQPLLRGFSPDLVIPRIDVLRAKISSSAPKMPTGMSCKRSTATTSSCARRNAPRIRWR